MTNIVKNPLTTTDLFNASEMFSEALQHVDVEQIRSMMNSDGDRMGAGVYLMREALRIAPSSGRRFLAGVVDMTPDEFDRQPATLVLDIIEELRERDDIADFFNRASQLLNYGAGVATQDDAEPSSGPHAATA